MTAWKKVDWLKIIKISIGCCFAVFLADWIGIEKRPLQQVLSPS